jgi:hypothetical protein
MKLSRTGWNNVIIFSVMIIILVINATNEKLFPKGENENKAEQLILPAHSVILTLAINLSENQQLLFERVGRTWQLTSKGVVVEKTMQQIEQMMFAWQQSSGLLQADEIFIDGIHGITVDIALAGQEQVYRFTLYPLADQLLIYQHQQAQWLALPKSLIQQLLPVNL